MKEVRKLPDWAERAIKTFIQAFFGVLIPQVVLVLNGALPENFAGWKVVLIPAVCSALASAISASWNIVQAYLKR